MQPVGQPLSMTRTIASLQGAPSVILRVMDDGENGFIQRRFFSLSLSQQAGDGRSQGAARAVIIIWAVEF